ALAPLSLAALALDADLAATLARWGVTTLGGLAALPREGLGARLGPAGLRAHDQALGRDREPFRAWTPPPFWEEAQELEWELDALDALAVVLARVLARLAARLEAAQLAAEALDVELALATGGRHARTVPLATPTCEVKPLLALLRLDLERHPPPAAVTRVVLGARTVRARAGQGGLWRPPAPAPRALGAVLARLAALVGGDNVGSPALLDSHRPDAHAMLAFAPPDEAGAEDEHRGQDGWRGRCSPPPAAVAAPPAGGSHDAWNAPARHGSPATPAADARTAGGADPARPRPAPDGEPEHRLVLRRARPPRRVEVETAGERPASVELGGGAERVVACAGPWRASGEWWDVGEWAREEWDVALAGGALCRLAWDRRTGAWCLDGTYD
ncbi:MAG: hypothetical protein HYV94_12605, partial [Candidatus Rokubacteria bacterium]|nr:hypothetical protein [Candidatus Rokubacteria bacterium]